MMFTSRAIFALFLLFERSQAASLNHTSRHHVSQHATRTSKVGETSSATLASAANAPSSSLNPNATDCVVILPNDALSAKGLSTPFLLQPPCSMTVGTQQAFAEAAVYDPATGGISIYHPLISDAGVKPAIAPIVPTLPAGAVVALWFGFNGGQLSLADTKGNDANNSPSLKASNCVNGLPGQNGDFFGQVSFCNAQQWFQAANAGIAAGKLAIPDLGTDSHGEACLTTRSFKMTDADPSDNLPTQYILTASGATAQDTKANAAAIKNGTVINNASDEALLANILDPLIGCTPFTAPSLDDPGVKVPAMALSELQATSKQATPVALVPLNDPMVLLTQGGGVSTGKANAYRFGVNQPQIGAAGGPTDGSTVTYCNNLVSIAPPFLKSFETVFSNAASPDTCTGNNLFTFLCARFIASVATLGCTIATPPVACKVDASGAATACTITVKDTTSSTKTKFSATAKAVSLASKATSALKSTTSSLTSSRGKKLLDTTSTAKTTALSRTSSLSPALATSTHTSSSTSTITIIITTITFFIFPLSLGGIVPAVLSNPSNSNVVVEEFVVLEEVFVSLPSAAAAACTHQFNSCAALAGSAFNGMDCLTQLQSCQGVASTVSKTASTPKTVQNTATIPATLSSIPAAVTGGPASASAAAGVVNANGAGLGAAGGQATCLTPAAQTLTETVTVTALPASSSGSEVAATTSAAGSHFNKHAKRRTVRRF